MADREPEHRDPEASIRRGWVARMRNRDWRIWFGTVVSLAWIIGGVVYLTIALRGAPTIADIGSFMEGAFAPLAFLWLVLGLFIQQRELADNTEVLRRTSIQSEKQTHAIAATELNARRETFFQIALAVRRMLGSISGMLYISSQGDTGSGHVDGERMNGFWEQYAGGDFEVFARLFLSGDYAAEHTPTELFYGTEVRRRHTRHYCDAFERLRRLAHDCDVDGIIEDSITRAGHGLLYQMMLRARPEADVE